MTLQFSLSHLILFVAGLLCTTTSSSSSSVTLSSSSARLSLTGTWRSFPGVDFSCDPPPPGGTEWVQRCGCWPCGGGAGGGCGTCGGGAGGVRTVRRGCGGGADRAAAVVRPVRRGCGGGVRTLRRGVGADFLAAALRGARGFARSSAAARVPGGNGVGRTPLVSCRNPCTSGSGRARCTWPFRRSFALSGVMPQV